MWGDSLDTERETPGAHAQMETQAGYFRDLYVEHQHPMGTPARVVSTNLVGGEHDDLTGSLPPTDRTEGPIGLL